MTKEIYKKTVFKKDGRARSFIIAGNDLYCKDFCDFYQISKDKLEVINQWRLGEDLQSDLCAISCDDEFVYVAIRNGLLCLLNRQTREIKKVEICDFSFWDMFVYKDLYAGNVNGELMIIDKSLLTIKQILKLHKKNLKSLFLNDNKLYTASQDLSLKVLNINTLETLTHRKNMHKRMFAIVGRYKDYLITTCPPLKETIIWSTSFEPIYTIPAASWNMIIANDSLYFDTWEGIHYISLQDLH